MTSDAPPNFGGMLHSPPTEDRNFLDHYFSNIYNKLQLRPIDPEDLAKAKNITPTHAVPAASYKVAIRARMKETFTQGYLTGVAT
ncbi:TPA: hypothetical protein VEM73_004624 [Pseudomonas aeruginosa]|uniref:hypothetical protein n=1 Tax=Pseudomonas aeruginosa TaxID=287 RepID=UPI000452569D|nr:hypothetical protein [Pseudomonas aeruginosa]AZM81783.1 hypothetical protein EIP87_07105 [Pseudomonas aeruginosa]EKL8564210.1 hypothetical protein [Pseudomonas aeruginosa]EKV4465382.1 hypothetical protein [Pseudomonas aeruginosa]EKV4470640.1 hypothetical protein [Pseudomonas aeruginosa]ELK4925494.1 hypothetical protein [Pseudomonas aeruginosa]